MNRLPRILQGAEGPMAARLLSRRRFSLILCCFLLTSCTGYHSYSVEDARYPVRVPTPPSLHSQPIYESRDFNIYQSFSDRNSYFVAPTKLLLTESHSRTFQAINLERNDGTHLIFIAHLSPEPTILRKAASALESLSIAHDSLAFYPVDALLLRLLTDPRAANTLRVTSISGRPSPSLPFSVLVVIQVRGSENMLSFKKLVESDAGYILIGFYDLFFGGNGDNVQTRSLQIIIRNALITSQTT